MSGKAGLDTEAVVSRVVRLSPEVSARWVAAVSALLSEMSGHLMEVATLDGAAQLIAEQGTRTVPGTQCVVSIATRERPDVFVVAGAAGGPWAVDLVGSEWPVEGTLHGRSMRGGEPVESTHAREESATPWAFSGGDIETGRLVPLRTGTPLADTRVGMGVIGFWRSRNEPFSDDERLLMDMFGELASVVVHRTELVHTAERTADRMIATVYELELLQEAANTLSSTLDREAIFAHTVSAAARLMTPPGAIPCRAALLLVDGGGATVAAEYDITGASVRGEVYRIAEHEPVRTTIDTRQTVVRDVRVGAAEDEGLAGLLRIGIVWTAMAPIIVEGRQVSAVVRVSSRDDRPFSEAQLARLTALAQVAGLALGNAERYQLARSEAERASELEEIKSQFLRLASHELRGPIAILGGYLSMLEDGSLPGATGQARTVLPLLRAKVNQMKRMVDDMLETARLEDRRLDLTLATVDLRDLARHAVDTMQPLLTERHDLVLSLGADPLPVRADRERTETIISNLLDNAVKYSPEGGRVECEVGADDGVAVVSVRDHGIGISEEDLGRLFTRFGRIVTPENSHIAGTGLGLHLAQRLAALHGGEIGVESSPGAGSTFTLRLPLQG